MTTLDRNPLYDDSNIFVRVALLEQAVDEARGDRKALHAITDAIWAHVRGRPSWAVTIILSAMTGIIGVLGTALATGH